MAWEWVAPVCTSGLGALGIVATGLTARGGRRHAEATAATRAEHERELAGDTRMQARLGDAYVELLSIVNRTAHYADNVRPAIDTSPPADPPPIPSVEEQIRAETLAMAYGSARVGELFETWRQTVWKIIGSDRAIANGIHQAYRSGFLEEWGLLQGELRPAQKVAREALAQQIAVELRSRTSADET